jgi:hypothetical protein
MVDIALMVVPVMQLDHHATTHDVLIEQVELVCPFPDSRLDRRGRLHVTEYNL